MSVTIKSPQEIELMREEGKILAKVHEQLGKELKPGMSTLEVDRLGEEMIRSFGCEPSFKGYQGYPASICVSINEEVVHGIPRADRIIEEGDIVSLDAGVIYKGYQSDAASTHGVGEISDDAKLLIERTRQSFSRVSSLRQQAIICIRFLRRSVIMPEVLAMESCVTCVGTASASICMKIRRSRISDSFGAVSS